MKELNVVLIADLHLGYNIGCKQMEQMTEKINEQNPDLVVVAGGIFYKKNRPGADFLCQSGRLYLSREASRRGYGISL